jgi:hypothetical protein
MKRRLGWLTLAVALAVPAAVAAASDGKAGNPGHSGAAADSDEHKCCPCCCHDQACQK